MIQVTLEPLFPIGETSYHLKALHYNTIGQPTCPYPWEEWKRLQPSGSHQAYKWEVEERVCISFTVRAEGITCYSFGPYGVLDSYLVGNPMNDIYFNKQNAEDEAFRRRYEVMKRMEGVAQI